MKGYLTLLSGGFAMVVLPLLAAPLDSSINYHGSLSKNGEPANGAYDLLLTLYDAEEGGALIGPTLTNANVTVAEGSFRTEMDFGAEAFNGSARWLEIGVRLNGSEETFVTLSPRQALSAVPYALYALQSETVPDGSVTMEKLAIGQVVKSLNGLTDQIELAAGSNIAVTQQGGTLTVAATVSEGPQGPPGPQGAEGPQGEIGPAGPAGEPGLNWRGRYDPEAAYVIGDAVEREGSSFIAGVEDPSGIPGEVGDWALLASRGAQGEQGLAGPSGSPGGIGPVGPPGPVGPQGPQGEPGQQGPEGPPGSVDGWSLTGNIGTDPSVNYLGTRDNQPLELRVGGFRALRLESGANDGGLVNVLGGHEGNHTSIIEWPTFQETTEIIPGDIQGAIIAAGGFNTISSLRDVWSDYTAGSDFSVISGGLSNRIWGATGAVIGGGDRNALYHYEHGADFSVIGGGTYNSSEVRHSVIAGGSGNHIGSGLWPTQEGSHNTISGGEENGIGGSIAVAPSSNTIGGGSRNFVRGGDAESVYGNVISGGISNSILGYCNSIGGGIGNRVEHASGSVTQAGDRNTIGGGAGNACLEATFSTIGGGSSNVIGYGYPDGGVALFNPMGATITGGVNNRATASYAAIAGGEHNVVEAWADYGVILGGQSNQVHSPYALVAGRRGKALHDGAFVWGDSTDADVESSATNEFTVRASGGVRFFSSADLSTGVTLAAGDGSWASVSDRNAKQDFAPIDGVAILEKVAALPLSTWSYKAQDSSIRHIGPMAQDFHTAFGLGTDNKRITAVDADGVALAAIQGLYHKLAERESEISELRQQNADLQNRLTTLERLVADIAVQRLAAQ